MQRIQQGEIGQAMANPNEAVNIAIGPPIPELNAQQPGTGLIFGNQIDHQPRRFIFKKAHLSAEDFRIFDYNTKRLVAVSHHWGKNPYEALDPLGIANNPAAHHGMLGEMESLCRVTGSASFRIFDWDTKCFVAVSPHWGKNPFESLDPLGIAKNPAARHGMLGEMESFCSVTGYQGMPSFKIRPAAVSMHGRQFAMDFNNRSIFSVAKRSRISSMSLRHNLEVSLGDSKDKDIYKLEVDLMGRTIQFKTIDTNQLVAIAAKSTKALIMSQVIGLGGGSEMIIDVAPGVDWTAICGVMMVLQQVGSHYLKDIFAMMVVDPLKDTVVDGAVQATGMAGLVDGAAQMTNQAIYYTHMGQQMQHQFQNNY